MQRNIFTAPGAHIIGDVQAGENVGIWYNAVVRGDTNTITIGDNSNVQDNATIHTDADFPVRIGAGVTIGHNAVVHGCTIGDNTVIGMGSIILNGAVIGSSCIIGAGSLVTGKMRIPDNSLAFGNPAKIVRAVTAEEAEANRKNAMHYASCCTSQNSILIL
ncbi:MAG: gamma carbonic anhydrase family protein [Lachnospiraceae bacterium]|nr:gamma carbonic anhydrase family protein [Lachnospiraceae bacterium]